MAFEKECADAVAAVQVRADPSAVEQILFNLVDNACKYAASGDRPSIRLAVTESGDRVAIRVIDRGPGIPEEDRKRVFRAFSKSAKDAANSAPGVGLGLSLSRRLAKATGGELLLEDGGGGAVFLLILPKERA